MENPSQIEKMLKSIDNHIKSQEIKISEQEDKIEDLEIEVDDLEVERDEAVFEKDKIETEIAHATYKVFGEEVVIMSSRMDIVHFFDTLSEMSKNFSPYQLEDIIKQIKR
jgi:hypothetical protein